MNLSNSLFLLLTLASALIHQSDAAAARTCEDQAACIDITTSQVDSDKCGTGDCEFEICVTITNSGDNCPDDSESWSHSCIKPDDVCLGDVSNFGPAADPVSVLNEVDILPDFEQCQIVGPGQSAQFLFKDGNRCDAGGAFAFGNASCEPRGDDVNDPTNPFAPSSCTGNAVGKECVWLVLAPLSCDVDVLCE